MFLESLGLAVTIMRITGLTKNEVNNKIDKLLDQGYLFLHGIIFKEMRVSSKGEEALCGYHQIYLDEDCKRVKNWFWPRGV